MAVSNWLLDCCTVCMNPRTQEIEITIGSADKWVYGINRYGTLLW